MREIEALRIGILWRGDPDQPAPDPQQTRLAPVFNELKTRGAQAVPVIYADALAESVRERLSTLDGVLVWVDPIVRGEDRTVLDRLLREAARRGVFVSAHPDVILRMGTKEVLYHTRTMPWGADIRLYRTATELVERLPTALRSTGMRVLKQYRGSSGDGVWRVELSDPASMTRNPTLRVQHGTRGSVAEELSLTDFAERCQKYFDSFSGRGCLVDQPYAERQAEGMIRCYLVHDRVVGFGHQFVTALAPPPAGQPGPPDPPPRLYHGPAKAEFQGLKRQLEDVWVAQMLRLLDIDRDALPVIWDADFLLGPKTASGEDTYLLCEINASGVFPIPNESFAPLAEAAVDRTLAARTVRSQGHAASPP